MKKIKVKVRIINNKLVYIVMAGCIDDRYVDSIWSSEKLANKRKQTLIDTNNYYSSYPDDINVDIVEMNRPIYES